MSQGWQANFNGNGWEQDLISRLLRHNYRQYREVPTLFQGEEPYFVHQCKGLFHSIYKAPMTVDIYLWHPWHKPNGLIIEGKYQEESGSVDEKFPYTIANLKATQKEAVLMLLGGGARREAVRWCQAQQDHNLTVFTTWDAWTRWLNNDSILTKPAQMSR